MKYIFTILFTTATLISCQSIGSNNKHQINLSESESSPASIIPTEATKENNSKGKTANEIHFTTAYIWKYKNHWLEKDEPGAEGEFWIMYDSATKSFLLTRDESFGNLGPMINWVLCKNDGSYYINSTDEFGKSTTEKVKINLETIKQMPEELKITNRNKVVHLPEDKNTKFNVATYTVKYTKLNETAHYELANSTINWAPIYQFFKLSEQYEISLPISYLYDMPTDKIIVSQKTIAASGGFDMQLVVISPTSYYININN